MSQSPSTPQSRGQTEPRSRANPRAWQAYWLNEDSFATTLLTMLVDRYGTESLEWHPETIRLQIHDDFQVTLPDVNLDKIMAGIAILTTDYFYTDVRRFIQLCNVLAGDNFDPAVFDPADAAEMAWAINEALLLSPPEDDDPFDDEIRAYITAVLRDEGFVTAPDVLKLGLNADLSDTIAVTFASDPEMFKAIHQTQLEKTAEVEELLQRLMAELWGQLQALPLKHGSVEGLFQKPT